MRRSGRRSHTGVTPTRAGAFVCADFLAVRSNALQARFMRQTLVPKRWEEFEQALSADFYERFKDPIEHVRDVHIAVGTKP